MRELSVQQGADRVVTLAIQWWEKEDQDAQHHTSHQELAPVGAQLAVESLHTIHYPGEIERNQSTEDTQQQHIRNALQIELLGLRELKHRLRTREDVGHGGCRDRRDQQGHDGGHGQVEHQHLHHKHQSSDRSLEDTGDRSGGTASHQEHQGFLLHLEDTSQVRTNGRTRQDNRCLGSD